MSDPDAAEHTVWLVGWEQANGKRFERVYDDELVAENAYEYCVIRYKRRYADYPTLRTVRVWMQQVTGPRVTISEVRE